MNRRARVIARNAVPGAVVSRVVEGERCARTERIDAGCLPTEERLSEVAALAMVVPRGLIDRREDEAVPDVEVRVAVIEGGVEGVGVAEREVAGVVLREGGAEVIERMGEGVVGDDGEAGMANVLGRELNVDGVIVRIAVRAAVVVI